jgi:signal transduction histidine kinase/ActR/RegA family two-component response regulator
MTFELFASMIHPDDRSRAVSGVDSWLRKGGDLSDEFRIVRPDGEVRWLAGIGRVYHDADGRPVRAAGVNYDVTDRRLAEAAARRRGELLDAVNRVFYEALRSDTLDDLGHRCLVIAEDLTGSAFGFIAEGSGEESLAIIAISDPGWEASDLEPPSLPNRLPQTGLLGAVIRDGHGFFTNDPARHPESAGVPDGHPEIHSFLGVPLLHEHTIVGMIGLANRSGGYRDHDLVAAEGLAPAVVQAILRRRAEVALKQLNQTLEARAEQRTRALHSAISRLEDEITQRQWLEEALRERSERLKEANTELTRRAEQLGRLTSQLTTAEETERARIGAILHDDLQQILVGAKFQLGLAARHGGLGSPGNGSGSDHIEQVASLLNEAIGTSRSLSHELAPPLLADEGLVRALDGLVRRLSDRGTLKATLSASPDAEPATEDARVFAYRAVQELLLNVSKHANTIAAEVEVTTSDDTVQITVRDGGVGFDHDALLEQEEGAGLGLFAIRERASLLGGSLQLDSRPGGGTIAHLILPRAEPSRATTTDTAHSLPSSREERRQREVRASNGAHRVLLVDDHDVVREGLRAVLDEENDVEVVGEAGNGEEAVALTDTLRPDVVLMDVSMPTMNGIEATAAITSRWPDTRIIGLSMHEREDMARAILDAGAEAYVSKADGSDQLLDAIRSDTADAKPT